MLPKSLLNYIPDPLLDNLDANGQALIAYMDNFCNEIFQDILNIWYFKFPEITPSQTLLYWNDYLEAEMNQNDTERQRREKLYTAVQRHKLRSTFEGDIKIRIDNVTGKDSDIVKATYIFEEDDSIITSGNDFIDTFYSTIGTDGVMELGTYIPDILTTVSITPGVIAIDLGFTEDDVFDIENDDSVITSGNDFLTTYYSTIGVDGIDIELGTFIPDGSISESFEEILDKVENELQDSLPAYFEVYLGYINDDGNFVTLRIL